MSEITLEDLLRDYRVFYSKLTGLKAAIIGFGGQVPTGMDIGKTMVTDNSDDDSGSLPGAVGLVPVYPEKKSWSDKIIYYLRNSFPKAMSAKELIESIEWQEKFLKTGKDDKVKKVVTQYTSSLAKVGRIGVNKEKSPHMYLYKQKPPVKAGG